MSDARHRFALAAAALGGLAAAGIWSHGAIVATPPGEPALIMLLRFMAVLKALCAVGAVALAAWRLRRPTPGTLAFGYLAAVALMAASPLLIWDIADLVAGAMLFHAGLLLFAGLAWADGRSWKGLPARRLARAPGMKRPALP